MGVEPFLQAARGEQNWGARAPDLHCTSASHPHPSLTVATVERSHTTRSIGWNGEGMQDPPRTGMEGSKAQSEAFVLPSSPSTGRDGLAAHTSTERANSRVKERSILKTRQSGPHNVPGLKGLRTFLGILVNGKLPESRGSLVFSPSLYSSKLLNSNRHISGA